MAVKFPIFMDSNSTTPVDPRVLEAMIPYFTEKFGHPGSRNHSFGWEAEGGMERAREQLHVRLLVPLPLARLGQDRLPDQLAAHQPIQCTQIRRELLAPLRRLRIDDAAEALRAQLLRAGGAHDSLREG